MKNGSPQGDSRIKPAGFDSKDSEFVSISSYEITLVKPNFNFLNGEDNYALV
jgi:hypothetical protein